MKRVLFVAFVTAAMASLLAAQTKAEKSVSVKVSYTGSGAVDEHHKILVFVFDSPDFMQGGVMPIGVKAASKKEDTVTFSSLAPEKVYVAAIYDPKGEYDGISGPPPQGSSAGLYATDPGVPAPVKLEAGKTAQIAFSFDDSVKMP